MDNSEWLVNSSDIIYDFLNSWVSSGTDENYSFFPDNSYSWDLRQSEETEYRFTWTWTQTANMLLSSSGIISYKVLLVNSSYTAWSLSLTWVTSSWFTNLSINLTTSYPTAILYLKNIWWLAKYNVSSSFSFLSSKRWYKITRDIGWKTYIKTIWEIINFTGGYLTWTFDKTKYQDYGLYRN